MKREQFTFYRSYYEAIKVLPQKEQTKVLLSLCAYALDEVEPSLSGVALSVFTLMRPTLDKGRKKAENRLNKGASNADENENKQKTNAEQNSTEGEKEREEEKEEEREYSPFYPPSSPEKTNEKQDKSAGNIEALAAELMAGCGEELMGTVNDWLKYKREKRQSYGTMGLKTLLGKIKRSADSYGEQAVIGVIRDSMSNSYQGIVWDRLERPKKGGSNGQTEYAGNWKGADGKIRYD